MDTNIANTDRQFLADLHRIGSATVPELCSQEGVTATAIRQRLLRLQAAGLISRESVRATRGRPHHEYRLTKEGQKLLGDNYVELATILWEQLSSIEDEQIKRSVMAQLRDTLVKRYGESVEGEGLAVRLEELKSVLSEHGFKVEVGQNGDQWTLVERNCPYHELASQNHSICDLEHEVFEKILGVPLELTQRCVDGHNCCKFETVSIGQTGYWSQGID